MTSPAKHSEFVLITVPYSAAIFDLDGVVTNTARTHREAWGWTFNRYLRRRSEDRGELFHPFSYFDYRDYVDGKARYDGAEAFLESRLISLPFGSPDDPPDEESICGLANKKTEHYLESIRHGGVQVYSATVDFIRTLRRSGLRIAVATSSKNRAEVLDSAGLSDLFDSAVDGNDLETLGLKGKPEPDIFRLAARRLGAEPHQTIVVEDAISGVQAARNGDFGLVVGISRAGREQVLLSAGADIVVRDLSEIVVAREESSGMQAVDRTLSERN